MASETAQWLRAFASPEEDPGSDPITQGAVDNSLL